MNILDHNRAAWNEEVKRGNTWTIPVSKEVIEKANQGQYELLLTPKKHVPENWLGDVRGKRILCLACGGGQQGPVLASAGAEVTVFDNSDQQLKQDQDLADEFGLTLKTIQGNMQDLSPFGNESFDLIFHPVSNCFIDDILPVWKESYRVLKSGGVLLSGFNNPLMYMIDWEKAEQTKVFHLVNPIPYSDTKSLSPAKKLEYMEQKYPFEFGHTLTDQIQGQIGVGFVITGFYEDGGDELFDQFTEIFIATKALKSKV